MLFKFVVPGMAVLAIAASAQTTTPAPTVKIVEEIVAKVNGEIITRGDLEEQYKQIELAATQAGLKGASRDDKVKDAKANVLASEQQLHVRMVHAARTARHLAVLGDSLVEP